MARTRRAAGAPDEPLPGFVDVAEAGQDGPISTLYARDAVSGVPVVLTLTGLEGLAAWAFETLEREIAALLEVADHPGLLATYGSFRTDDGRLAVVSERSASSLVDVLSSGGGSGLAVADVLALGVRLGAGLDAAHRVRVLHREVTPQHVHFGDTGEAALAGFGVALARTAIGPPPSSVIAHSAPELFARGGLSPATDVYGLASTLYSLVVGRPAFEPVSGDTATSIIRRVLRDPVVPPGSEVPSPVSRLLVQAMAKSPRERPSTAAEFVARLGAVEDELGMRRTPIPAARVLLTATGRHAAPDRRPADAPAPSRSDAPAVPTPAVPMPAVPDPGVTGTDWSTPTVSRHAVREDEADASTLFAPSRAPSAPHPATPPAVAAPTPATEPPPSGSPMPLVQWRGSAPPAEPGERLGRAEPASSEQVPALRPEPRAAVPPPPVPMWTPGAQEPAPSGGLRLDPAALRREVTLRAAGAALSVDASRVVSRQWLKKQEVAWTDVRDIGIRWDADGTAGVVVLATAQGSVELPATRGTSSELRTTYALLAAYRQRSYG